LGTEVWNDYSSFGETSHFTNKVIDQEVEGGKASDWLSLVQSEEANKSIVKVCATVE
jgi:hypothetical protein